MKEKKQQPERRILPLVSITKVERGGTIYTMQTANIGQKKPPEGWKAEELPAADDQPVAPPEAPVPPAEPAEAG